MQGGGGHGSPRNSTYSIAPQHAHVRPCGLSVSVSGWRTMQLTEARVAAFSRRHCNQVLPCTLLATFRLSTGYCGSQSLKQRRRRRRLFLRKLKMELKIPVLALVDSDPYGLKILSVYMKGAPRAPARRCAQPCCPAAEFLPRPSACARTPAAPDLPHPCMPACVAARPHASS